jgi:hypothetical protein
MKTEVGMNGLPPVEAGIARRSRAHWLLVACALTATPLAGSARAQQVEFDLHGDTANSPTWTRPNINGAVSDVVVPYEEFSFQVAVSGVYGYYTTSLSPAFDVVQFMYDDTFNPFSPLQGLLSAADQTGKGGQEAVMFFPSNGRTYHAVTTGFAATDAGPYSLRFSGPGAIAPVVAKSWLGGESPDWTDPGNWSSAGVPTDLEDVLINSTIPNATVVSGASVTSRSIAVGFAAAGSLSVQDGGEVVAVDRLNVGAQGALRGDGAITASVTSNGLVAPGVTLGTLHIAGDYTQSATGRLAIEISSNESVDVLDIVGGVSLNGTLDLSLVGDFVPAGPMSFDVIDWTGALQGTFAQVHLPALPGIMSWDASQLYTTGVLAVVSADFDGDGVVDGDDLAPLVQNFGALDADAMHGDADGDLDVDGADFLAWQRQQGVGEPVVGAVAPEPMTSILMAGSLALLASRACTPFSIPQRQGSPCVR